MLTATSQKRMLAIALSIPAKTPKTRKSTYICSKATRLAIYNRDNNKCIYCNSTSDKTLDHIVSRHNNGSNDVSNLVTACRSCNSSKGKKPLAVFLHSLTVKGLNINNLSVNRVINQASITI